MFKEVLHNQCCKNVGVNVEKNHGSQSETISLWTPWVHIKVYADTSHFTSPFIKQTCLVTTVMLCICVCCLQSFVSCSLGIWKVGLVTLPFGVVNALVSFCGGYVIKYIGRMPVFIAGLFIGVLYVHEVIHIKCGYIFKIILKQLLMITKDWFRSFWID